VGVSLEQRFNYQDSIDIPAQAGNLADTLQFDEKHTFVGANLGLDALTRWGGTFRVNGAVLHSADQTALIGTVGFRYRFES
jgi:hypothetical protein